VRAGLAKRKIAAKHRPSCVSELAGQSHQEWGIAVPTGSVGKNQSIDGWYFRSMQKAAHGGSCGGVKKNLSRHFRIYTPSLGASVVKNELDEKIGA
jgi:hypothetical protein